MWKFRSFSHKEQTGLEDKTIEVGNLKVTIKSLIAQGGFSCVYLARNTTNNSKQYAVKHIICNDQESLSLVMKEISVMKSLRGHPNIVMLYAHTIFDMGRTKEALLVMEHCEKSLVNVLESRGGAGYFVEKKILLMFRDFCNAVFAMHCQSPPIAHRDLKAENLLLGYDGLWKLCDFGSISTNHKCFVKAEDMGIEEDTIRKHTTPAYRAPEMWDLLRKEFISEKVDIWALGCLLFRICYLKPAFDGESKLQILNGNYRIPDLPNYSAALRDLIQDMLHSSPKARPNITQAWHRVNDLLPDDLQKLVPDCPPDMPQCIVDKNEGTSTSSNTPRNEPRGAFWATQHAKNCENDSNGPTSSKTDPAVSVNNSAFNDFVAEFGIDNKVVGPVSTKKPLGKEEVLEGEVERLKEQLKQANVEKDEVSSKCEKLTAICRSQRQEIQGLKQALASRTQSLPCLSTVQQSSIQDQESLFENNSQRSVAPNSWQAFPVTEVTPSATSWGFQSDSFSSVPTSESKNVEKSTSQPAGWAGF